MRRDTDPVRVTIAGSAQAALEAPQPRPAAPSPAAHGSGGLRPAAGVLLALSLASAPLLAACGSSSGHPTASAASLSAACTQVSGALADGPDPDSDPVGYAEAQIKPLRAIKTGDAALRTAVAALATAYAGVYSSDGTDATATKAVTSASKKVNSICPGAAS